MHSIMVHGAVEIKASLALLEGIYSHKDWESRLD